MKRAKFLGVPVGYWVELEAASQEEGSDKLVARLQQAQQRVEELEVEREQMLKDVWSACFFEYMECPFCYGHIGHDANRHGKGCVYEGWDNDRY